MHSGQWWHMACGGSARSCRLLCAAGLTRQRCLHASVISTPREDASSKTRAQRPHLWSAAGAEGHALRTQHTLPAGALSSRRSDSLWSTHFRASMSLGTQPAWLAGGSAELALLLALCLTGAAVAMPRSDHLAGSGSRSERDLARLQGAERPALPLRRLSTAACREGEDGFK